MRLLIGLYGLAALAAALLPTPEAVGVTEAFVPLALGAISALGTVGGLIQGARRQRSADRLNNEAVGLAREDYNSRQGFRDRASSMLLGDQPVAPTFRGVAPGQASDFSVARQEFGRARLPGMGDAARTAQGFQLGALGDVSGGADRGEIASMRFQNLLDQAGETRKLGTEQIGQDAARLGRIGMGGVTTSLGNLEERIQTGITRAGRDLAAEAAAGDISDRFNRLGAISGVAGQLRDADFREGSTRADLALRRGGAETDLGQIEFGQGAVLRGEQREERGTERDFFDRDQANRFGLIDRVSGIGFTPPPVATLMAGANAQQQAGQNAGAGAGGLLQQYLQYLSSRGGAAAAAS